MKSLTKAAGVVTLVGLLLGCAAVPAANDGGKPGVLLGSVSSMVATVESVDLDTREVVLRDGDGEIIRFVAGEEVRNLAQVEVGDQVLVEHSVGLLLMAAPATGEEPMRADVLDVWRAELGQRPGVRIEHTAAAVGIVTAVDAEARTVTIKGVERTVVLEAAEDIDLGAIDVGDEVNALFQESIVISVEPAPAGQ
jgi:hypothetical protein